LTISQLNHARMCASLRLRTWMLCGYKHNAEINPFRVLWINPDQIGASTNIVVPKGGHFSSRVLDGDWDLSGNRFEDRSICSMLIEHFQNGIRWSDTWFYEEILKRIKEKGTYWNDCCSEADVMARCDYLDKLFESIKNSGYTIPEGLRYGETGLTKACIPQEIAVNISRDGRFIFWDGRHRLMIAKILKLPLIPVRVVVRHKLWQELRDKIVVGKRQKKLLVPFQALISHPDISCLVS
jgi:hypothetical protein